jgi:raffinose/stachyose/melibiose transport system substrate-binding protein
VRSRLARLAIVAAGVLVLAAGAAEARPASSSPVAISMLSISGDQTAFNVLIPNFERVYPDITVNATYAANTAALAQLETTELAAGTAPDLLDTSPGCGAPYAICEFATAGELAPLVNEPWTKRSLPAVTSALKHGQALYGFQPVIAPFGVFTDDALFSRLGLKVPQTFEQLLALCQKAQNDGTTAVVIGGGSSLSPSLMVYALATANLYGQDRQWNSRLKAGTVTFDGSSGWHQALQDVIEMTGAGCFEPGVASEPGTAATALFVSGGGLMYATSATSQGVIAAASPSFPWTFHPFPSGASATGTNTFINVNDAFSVNAHASAANQAAARTFLDFIARPKQDALFAQLTGGVTQYQFLKQQLPTFMSSFAPVLAQNAYILKPSLTWWNASVSGVLQTDTIGLTTGQITVDGILQAMDAAWKQGPS